jgi:hypothetical protein
MDFEDSDDEEKRPSLAVQKLYDLLKFVIFLTYQATLLIFIAYYSSSRFANIYLKQLFYLFLVARPVAIVCFTTYQALCNSGAAFMLTNTIR